MTQKVVYIHKTKDTNKIFYVGIGSLKRSKSRAGRNEWWQRITNKHNFIVEILYENLTVQKAKIKEIEIIKKYKSDGIELCNLTNGGDGRLGGTQSEEWKKKHSLFLRGNSYGLGKPAKEPIIGINLQTKDIVKFSGRKAIENSGIFSSRQVYRCASRDKICKSTANGLHKGFQFFWESDYLRKVGTQNHTSI